MTGEPWLTWHRWGENVYVVGGVPQLGSWDPARAVRLGSGSYPVWRADIDLPAGTVFQYKYIRRRDGAAGVTWETGANRTATVPASGRVTLTGTWRG
ncbi:carbohydrate-binding module family 20 domain-containing protein [Streptomyces sp. MS19]|uniref:carbohydrate-binding module family 20 domain-containing protein n=1 Tax=Streptomyces sp. MS19 TaxID=3385972 RepID=UPI0039A06033